MSSLSEAIARNRARVRYQYPMRLPLPHYHAWELLTDAIEYLKIHATQPKPAVFEFANAGDWEASVTLYRVRAELCTPAKADPC
jgi:hypothetical protein